MKKLLLVLIILGVAGALAYLRFVNPPEKRACQRLAELCLDDPKQTQTCQDLLDSESGTLNAEEVNQFIECVTDSRSCVQASGCLIAAGANRTGRALRNLVDGIERGLTE